jgi:hypothetical protein
MGSPCKKAKKTLSTICRRRRQSGRRGAYEPSVVLLVSELGTGLDGVVEAASLRLLGESDKVGGLLEVPLLVRPEGTGSTEAGLDLVKKEVSGRRAWGKRGKRRTSSTMK